MPVTDSIVAIGSLTCNTSRDTSRDSFGENATRLSGETMLSRFNFPADSAETRSKILSVRFRAERERERERERESESWCCANLQRVASCLMVWKFSESLVSFCHRGIRTIPAFFNSQVNKLYFVFYIYFYFALYLYLFFTLLYIYFKPR